MAAPASDGAATPAKLRADGLALLSYIHGIRSASIGREIAASELRGWLVGRFWFGLLLLLAALGLYALLGGARGALPWLGGVALIAFAGRTGALVSIGRRAGEATAESAAAGDAILAMASMGVGRAGLRAAMIAASVFALLVYALFASGVPALLGLTGGVAPVFTEVQRSESRAALTRARSDAFARREELVEAEKALADCRTGGAATPAAAELPPPSTGAAAPADAASATATPATATPATAAPADADTCAALSADAVSARTQADNAEREIARLKEAARFAGFAKAPGIYGGWTNPLASALGLASVPDLFKLLVWAFLAGWLERLVPDMLNSLAARSAASQKREDAAKA